MSGKSRESIKGIRQGLGQKRQGRHDRTREFPLSCSPPSLASPLHRLPTHSLARYCLSVSASCSPSRTLIPLPSISLIPLAVYGLSPSTPAPIHSRKRLHPPSCLFQPRGTSLDLLFWSKHASFRSCLTFALQQEKATRPSRRSQRVPTGRPYTQPIRRHVHRRSRRG